MDKNQYSDTLKQMEAYLVDGLEFKVGGLGEGELGTATRGP